ncbi:MAG: DNA mismatch repair endonuclease MutL [Ruminococcaceae bacterium]|nr:DNA mismatch repair endonuclease MutL [Oscillospiraceae bacterium]
MKIKVLDKKTAELIAAGEVVENPSCVVKELIENSVDSGATKITVEIKNGGKEYIRITDNGCGMSKEDAETAFVRHATSKISTADDLFNINTLGFRGEALASICAVSKTQLITKEESSQTGTDILVEGNELIYKKECGCANGTTVVVRELFYNTPARLAFLKKDSTEAALISTVVQNAAISNPQIAFTFIKDGAEALYTAGDGKLMSVIYSLFGKFFASSMLEVEFTSGSTEVSGYISKPVYSKANRNMQLFFVNSRSIKSKLFSAALEDGYRGSVMGGKFPACVLNVKINPKDVDVNVHPQKAQVKFSDEPLMFNIICDAVKSTLDKDSGRVEMTIDSPKEAKNDFIEDFFFKTPSTPQENKAQTVIPKVEINAQEYVKPNTLHSDGIGVIGNDLGIAWNVLKKEDIKEIREKESFEKPVVSAPIVKEEPLIEINKQTQLELEQKEKEFSDPYIVTGELFSTYIIAQNSEKALIIDKHAAHERIIFEQLKSREDGFESQVLLEPITLNLSKTESEALLSNKEKLQSLGFYIDEFGFGTVIVREVPELMEYSDIESAISEIAQKLVRGATNLADLKVRDDILHSVACKAAIKAGYYTSEKEKQELVNKVLEYENVKYCPHGRPIAVELTKTKLEKMFKR